MIGIYSITNKVNGKRYIGKSEDIESRTAGFHRNKRLDSAIKHYGIENFYVEVIEECSKEELNDREKYWISHYHTYINDPECHGYNMTKGGDGVDSESASRYNKEYWMREGVRESRSGENHHFYGKHLPIDTRLRMSKAKKGVKMSDNRKKALISKLRTDNPMFKEESRKRLSEARLGMKFSDDHRQHISESMKGRVPWNKGKELPPLSEEHKRKISEAVTGKEFTQERCDNISKAKKGKVGIHRGTELKYIDEKDLNQYLADGWEKGNPPRVYNLTCKKCGNKFEASHNGYKYCPDCR